MAKRVFKVIAVLALIVGGLAVIADFFGTGTGRQYLFNFIYFIFIIPAFVAVFTSKRDIDLICKGDE